MRFHPFLLVALTNVSGLDLVTKSKLFKDIKTLASEQTITILLVTHDPFEATALCDRAVVLESGRVEEVGVWKELLQEPRSAILRVFREQLKAQVLG